MDLQDPSTNLFNLCQLEPLNIPIEPPIKHPRDLSLPPDIHPVAAHDAGAVFQPVGEFLETGLAAGERPRELRFRHGASHCVNVVEEAQGPGCVERHLTGCRMVFRVAASETNFNDEAHDSSSGSSRVLPAGLVCRKEDSSTELGVLLSTNATRARRAALNLTLLI